MVQADVQKPPRKNKYVIACTVLASANSILFGYDVGVMSGAVLYIRENLHVNDIQIEILISSLNFISLLGSALAGRTSDWIGRRWTMCIAAVIFAAGAFLMAFAPNYAILLVGRLVSGIGVGYSLMIAPVYTAEVTPAESRGKFSCFPEMFVNIGILIGYIVNFGLQGLPSHINWRIMLGLGAVPPLLIALAVIVMPESPRWLVMKGRKEEAMKVLIKTMTSEAEAKERLDEIAEGIQYAREQAGGNSDEGSWKEVLMPSPVVRRMLIAGLGVQLFQQATGTDSVVYYSPTIFKTAGVTSEGGKLGATIAVGVSKLALVIVACFLIDKVGRRVLLLASTVGLCASLLAMATSLVMVKRTGSKVAAYISIFSACANVGAFSIGMGPVNWVLGAEIYPLRIRAKAASIGVAVNRCMSGIISLTFLTISNEISVPGTFFVFAGIAVIATMFVYFIVPETKGKSLEEIVAQFHSKPGDVPSIAELGLTPTGPAARHAAPIPMH